MNYIQHILDIFPEPRTEREIDLIYKIMNNPDVVIAVQHEMQRRSELQSILSEKDWYVWDFADCKRFVRDSGYYTDDEIEYWCKKWSATKNKYFELRCWN